MSNTTTTTQYDVTVPPVFFDDTRRCVCFKDEFTWEEVGPASKRKVRASLSGRDVCELYNRADYYASSPDHELYIRSSARATLRALDKQVDWSNARADEREAETADKLAREEAAAAAAAYVPTMRERLVTTLLAGDDATDLMVDLGVTEGEQEVLRNATEHIVSKYGKSIVHTDDDRAAMLWDVYEGMTGLDDFKAGLLEVNTDDLETMREAFTKDGRWSYNRLCVVVERELVARAGLSRRDTV